MASGYTRHHSKTNSDYGGKSGGKAAKIKGNHVKWGVDESPKRGPDMMEKAGKALRAGRLR